MADLKLNGLIVTYRDDELNESVRSTLKGKSRVRYKCMDTFAHFLAFGTSSGAVYLFRLNPVTHSTCSLMSMIPCDQGSIEVIKFLPNLQSDDLLIVIGTSRGSIVVLRLFQAPGEQNAYCDEIYKAEYFTNNSSIKIIESDQDLLDPTCPFSRLYICDSANRVYVLESTTIYANKNSLRLFRQSHLPALIFSVNDSNINQISVNRSQLLISSDETTRLFNEQSNQLNVIGKKKRKLGFYGACFFNPNYKPTDRLAQQLQQQQQQQQQQQSQNTSYSSLVSLNDLESLLIFVARPVFRLWQVNYQCDVMFTHQFEPLLKTSKFTQIVEIENAPFDESKIDDPTDVMRSFQPEPATTNGESLDSGQKQQPRPPPPPLAKSDHFHKLIPFYSSTLGNLLLSYSQHELFIVDPIGAELVTWCSFKWPIVQLCSNENEIFVWSQVVENDQKQFHLQRLVLLAPTQFVLELHRIHRYLTLVMFVQQFCELFRDRMALPLDGPNIITTEGGLLRNILLNAWDLVNQWRVSSELRTTDWLSDLDGYCAEFKRLVEEIVDESKQLKSSLENLTDSRFFLAMANENIDRLLSEPYASLVSLEVSIAELHTNHVIHFSREALNRHKSVANLSQNIRNAIHEANNRTKSSMDLSNGGANRFSSTMNNLPSKSMRDLTNTAAHRAKKTQVIVERQRPKRSNNFIRSAAATAMAGSRRFDKVAEDSIEEQTSPRDSEGGESAQRMAMAAPTFFSVKEAQENLNSVSECTDLIGSDDNKDDGTADLPSLELDDANDADADDDGDHEKQEAKKSHAESLRCKECHWPRARSHLEPVTTNQLIQRKWIEDNLAINFIENIDQIEERAFRYGLWNVFLKCLAFKRQIDDYITCCMLLDDVRLLDIEQLVIICSGEDEMMNLLLSHLNRRMQLQESLSKCSDGQGNGRPNLRTTHVLHCLKCEKEYDSAAGGDEAPPPPLDHESRLEVPKENKTELIDLKGDDDDDGDRISFNLANLFDQFIMRNNSNIKKMVGHFLNYSKLLNSSRIPTSLYLKAIESTINRAKRASKKSPISKQDSFWNMSRAS